MKIIYTVFGEGNGHAFRSYPVIRHLRNQGHEVRIVASDKSFKFLSTKYNDVYKITSLNMVYENNAVMIFKTLVLNIKKISKLSENLKVFKNITNNFKPDAVITDFEPMGMYLAEISRVPLISIDNMHIITDTNIKTRKEDRSDALIAKTIIKGIVPKLDYSFITTFFYPTIKKGKINKTFLVPPIIRDEIVATKPAKGEHILVYQTSNSYEKLLYSLKESDENFIVYNTNESVRSKNITYRQFNDKQILDDLAKAKGIIANGGFTLISEALFLGKPILSIPVENQYEQTLNALMVEKLGLGLMGHELNPKLLQKWLLGLPKYQNNIKKIKFGNEFLFQKLDTILANIKVSA